MCPFFSLVKIKHLFQEHQQKLMKLAYLCDLPSVYKRPHLSALTTCGISLWLWKTAASPYNHGTALVSWLCALSPDSTHRALPVATVADLP